MTVILIVGSELQMSLLYCMKDKRWWRPASLTGS